MINLSNRIAISMASFVCVLLSLAGCATFQPEDSEKWREAQRPALQMRAEARWSALIKGDFEKTYSFSSPESRAVVSLQQFRGGYGRAIGWRLARVVNVSYDDPTVAKVSVEVTYQIDLPGNFGEKVETAKVISEKWIYKDREWWYTSN